MGLFHLHFFSQHSTLKTFHVSKNSLSGSIPFIHLHPSSSIHHLDYSNGFAGLITERSGSWLDSRVSGPFLLGYVKQPALGSIWLAIQSAFKPTNSPRPQSQQLPWYHPDDALSDLTNLEKLKGPFPQEHSQHIFLSELLRKSGSL
ncbi:hypothetical protein AAHA92_15397 [Salvia divinorum]|uniref:Uncharacterized protein n=1 Tax=Salvia divinorum TaxID=28513 RepID=A0ABD1HF58_SALDI